MVGSSRGLILPGMLSLVSSLSGLSFLTHKMGTIPLALPQNKAGCKSEESSPLFIDFLPRGHCSRVMFSLCSAMEPWCKAQRPSMCGGLRATERSWGPRGAGREPPRRRGAVLSSAALRPHLSPPPLLLQKAQPSKGSGRKTLNLPTFVERGSDLLASGPDHWVGASLQFLSRGYPGRSGVPLGSR